MEGGKEILGESRTFKKRGSLLSSWFGGKLAGSGYTLLRRGGGRKGGKGGNWPEQLVEKSYPSLMTGRRGLTGEKRGKERGVSSAI